VAVVTTREAGPADVPFLREVFAESGAGGLASLVQFDGGRLIDLQFAAQQAGYAAQFPGAAHEIILVDGEPAGQVRWADLGEEVRIIDIALLPRCRRQGAARAVYRIVLAHAHARGKPARASVARFNAVSLAFHERLGFTVEHENETHLFLVAGSIRTGTGGE
jgi:ribosomal protein S18 acetylase RimI-like enzyme